VLCRHQISSKWSLNELEEEDSEADAEADAAEPPERNDEPRVDTAADAAHILGVDLTEHHARQLRGVQTPLANETGSFSAWAHDYNQAMRALHADVDEAAVIPAPSPEFYHKFVASRNFNLKATISLRGLPPSNQAQVNKRRQTEVLRLRLEEQKRLLREARKRQRYGSAGAGAGGAGAPE